MSWVAIADLARLPPGRRDMALARAWVELALLHEIAWRGGPVPAALACAAFGAPVRIRADGELLVWDGAG